MRHGAERGRWARLRVRVFVPRLPAHATTPPQKAQHTPRPVAVRRGTAPNRRRSGGATPDFSPCTAYDFENFVSRQKTAMKRGAVANAHSGTIHDRQNNFIVV